MRLNKHGLPIMKSKVVKAQFNIYRVLEELSGEEPDREKILLKSNRCCWYCGKEIEFSRYANQGTATLDHVIPRYSGGEDSEENLVAACHKCNNDKGCMSLAEFRALKKPQDNLFYGETLCQRQV